MTELQVDPNSTGPMSKTTAAILICLVCVPIMFWNLNGRDLWAPDEPRFAQIAREMVRSGDWVVPRMNGQEVALLPPLTYWLVALPSTVAGDVTEFTARVPLAVLGLAGVFAVFCLGNRMFGCRVGLFSALILATSFKYLWQTRWLQADMVLATFDLLALLFFYWAFTAERRKWIGYHLFCICIGLAVLAKGPVGVVLPGLVILPLLTWTRSWPRIREMWVPTGIVAFLVIVLPWYVAVGLRGGGDFLHEVVIKHNFGMFFETWSHKQPIWYYVPHVFWLMMPWSLFIFPALLNPVSEEERDHRRFLLCWVVTQFVFFSISEAKQEKYLLPMLPAVAILIGKCWADYIDGHLSLRLRKVMTVLTAITAVQLIVAGPAIAVISRLKLPHILGLGVVSGAIFLAGGILLLAFLWQGRLKYALISLVVFCFVVHVLRVGWIMPSFDVLKSARDFCSKVNDFAREDEPVGIYGVKYRQIGAYCFYLDRRVKTFENEKEDFVQALLEEEMLAPDQFLCIVRDSYLPFLLGWRPNLSVLHSQRIGHRLMHLISNGKQPRKGVPGP